MLSIRQIVGTWLLADDHELLESFDYKSDAEKALRLALFDKRRSWTSLYDTEKRSRTDESRYGTY